MPLPTLYDSPPQTVFLCSNTAATVSSTKPLPFRAQVRHDKNAFQPPKPATMQAIPALSISTCPLWFSRYPVCATPAFSPDLAACHYRQTASPVLPHLLRFLTVSTRRTRVISPRGHCELQFATGLPFSAAQSAWILTCMCEDTFAAVGKSK
jgi:hypothetical protein